MLQLANISKYHIIGIKISQAFGSEQICIAIKTLFTTGIFKTKQAHLDITLCNTKHKTKVHE